MRAFFQTLEPAMQKRSFQQLTIAEGFEPNRRGHHTLRIGIDASIWMCECTAAHQARGLHHQSGENPELATFFYKCSELAKYAATPIFVLDGDRPNVKRGKQVINTPHWLTDRCKEIITAFGFHYHTAPGEAEAELAQLNQMGLIDAIFTTDSDVFVFGATHMITSPSKDDYKAVHIYTAEAIQHQVHLSLGGLLLMAILIGGDYDPVGLEGCAVKTAYALAKCGLGDSLLLAAQTLDPAALDNFLVEWRKTLRRELLEGKSGRKHPAIAEALTDDFPDPRILDLYVHPLTSWSNDGPGVDTLLWVPLLPNVTAIAQLCELLFSWGTVAELPNKLFKHVLPGLCSRRLAQVCC
ncbi:PIN domain-like protein [Mycena crocata]|nr:PIN domain-like protein [Mycena crocata]KAJ7151420.1 PIN domain-like protein [Mycena crocata]